MAPRKAAAAAKPDPTTQPTWPIDNLERRAVSALLPYAKNARKHTAEQIEQIARSITEWGWTMPILVDEGGEVIAGHARLEAAKRLNIVEAPVMVAKGWSPAQKRAYVIADNQLALTSSWDAALLSAEVGDLRDAGFAIDTLGLSAVDIAGLLAVQPRTGTPQDAPEGTDADPADAVPDPPRTTVSRLGDLWLLGDHRLLCGDSTSKEDVLRVLGGEKAGLLFTSPPYGNQRAYKTGGISDWDQLMQGVFAHSDLVLKEDGQILVNLGLIHREGEWMPYWEAWVAWMRERGWRRFGWYVWDQGPALPGDWNGRLGPAFEFVFHMNREIRRPNKWIPCSWAGHIAASKGGLRASDGTVGNWQHAGRGIQETRIPDGVLRITRHKGRGIEVEHPAVFPVLLPEFVMHSYAAPGELCFEPFGGSGTSIVAGQRAARRVAAIELAPSYADVTVARWRELFPDIPVTLEGDGRTYEQVATERAEPAKPDKPASRAKRAKETARAA